MLIPPNTVYADPYITGLWCGVHGTPKALGSLFSYHISTTELPEQQEKPDNKMDVND
jgi:hypothetical protein